MTARVALIAALSALLTNCNALPPQPDASQPSTGPDYGPIVAAYVRGHFKATAPPGGPAPYDNTSSYSDFEISNLRWVHAMSGWSWLVCIRFQDRGRSYAYALYIQANAVTDARYALEVDNCGAQNYVPFDITTGAIGQPTPAQLQPLH